jgi:hypothetical protein
MRDLRLVGLSEDGTRLVLVLPGGEEFGLPVDERVQAALQGDRARLGQLQIELESRLRPREIQDRIRAGQSPEEVADEAGIPVERVLRYAWPILHEREHIAQKAAAVGVRRDDHGAVQLLGELVGDRLEQRGVPRELLNWDSWRLEDGRWEVRLDYLAGDSPRSAQWVYDPSRMTVTADDDEARWLLEEEPTATITPIRPPDAAAVPADVAEVIGLVETDPAVSGAPEANPAAREVTAAEGTEVRHKSASRNKRASVPSWDEILFGSKKPE